MSEHTKQPNNPAVEPNSAALPKGCVWAIWSRSKETGEQWRNFDETVRQAFRARMEMIVLKNGLLPHEKFYVLSKTDGIGMAKIDRDNPGWRGFLFREGNTWVVTHFARKKPKDDHKADGELAMQARIEHRRVAKK